MIVMSETGHNTNISRGKLGPVRLPSDRDPELWRSGEPTVYHMSPEEIAARYGPPGQGAKKFAWRYGSRLTRERLEAELVTLTVGQVAVRHNTTQGIVFALVENYGLELNGKNRLNKAVARAAG